METLTVRVEHDPDGTPVVVLAGQLDLATARQAEHAFETLPAPEPTRAVGRDLVVDMTDLTFMDSTGLAVLLGVVNRGHALRLRRPPGWIRRVIVATGLSQTLLPVERQGNGP